MRLHPKRWSLATKWSLMLTALALGPLLAVVGLSYQSASSKLVSNTVTQLHEGATDGAANLDDALAERVRQVKFLAGLPSVKEFVAVPPSQRYSAQVALTADLLGGRQTYSFLQALDILDSQGTIIYSTAGRKGTERDQALLRSVGSGQVYIGGFQEQTGKSEPMLVLAVPVNHQTFLRTETSSQFLIQRAGRQSGVYSMLVDKDDRVIASTGGVAAGQILKPDETGRYTLSGGEQLYVHTGDLTTLPWKYVVALPESKLAAELDDERGKALLLALGTSLIIGSLARLLALGFTRPLVAMAAATRALAAGDLTHEVKPTSRQDEVGQLQNAFADAYQHLRRLAARMRLSSILVAEAAGHMHSVAAEHSQVQFPMTTASEKLAAVAKDLDRQVAHFRV